MGKQRLGFLSDFVEAITRRKRGGEAETLKALARPASERARVACAVLMGRIGDAARVAVAEQALSAYAELDAEERLAFFRSLRDDHGVDADAIRAAYAAWDARPDAAGVARLFEWSSLPARPCCAAEHGAGRHAAAGADASGPAGRDAHRPRSGADRPGFRASVRQLVQPRLSDHAQDRLERARRDPGKADGIRKRPPDAGLAGPEAAAGDNDRRLYAFFHPATGDEPLIFVEVALTQGMPDAIGPILTAPDAREPAAADTAVFYSINNSLPGLKGVSFGNFLIKQVVAQLSADLPELRCYVTLSPVPALPRGCHAGRRGGIARRVGRGLGR